LSTEDIPTSEELYRREVRCIPRLTVEKEWEIIRRALEGDKEARTALMKSCLNYVGYIAAWHARYVLHDDYLDLVGIGNAEVVERFDEALTKENPGAYLRGCAKREENKSVIDTQAVEETIENIRRQMQNLYRLVQHATDDETIETLTRPLTRNNG